MAKSDNIDLTDYFKVLELILIDTANYQGQIDNQIRVSAIDNFGVIEVK